MNSESEANTAPKPSSLRRNVASLSVVLAANTIIPLITLPYVTRTLGADTFGKVAFVQVVMTFVMLFTDYAFSWSAVRDVASARNDKRQLSRLFYSIWAAQWMLTAVAGLALSALALVLRIVNYEFMLFTIGFLAVVVGNTLFPLWFFQGLERMGEIALIQISTRLCSIPAIFLLVTKPEDALIVLGVQAGVAMLAGVFSLFYILRSDWVHYYQPSCADVASALRSGWTLFLSKIGISLYTTLAPLALGLVAGSTAVSYFSLADRIRAAGQSLLTPLANALFPRLSHLFDSDRESANRLVVRGFSLTLLTASIISLGLFCLAGPAIHLLGGHEFESAKQVLQVLAVLPVLVGLSNVFGVQVMLANGRVRPFNLILAGAAIIGVIVIWPLSHWMGAVGAALSVVIVELFVTCTMALYLSRNPDLWKS